MGQGPGSGMAMSDGGMGSSCTRTVNGVTGGC
jgi:hypothetical protein